MIFQDKIEENIKSWGDDVVTALLVVAAMAILIVALRSNLAAKVAVFAYLVIP